MCGTGSNREHGTKVRTIPVTQAIGMVLPHDVTEIRQGEFKGPAFRKGHVIRQEDVCHLQRLGKENLFVLNIEDYEMHEDEAAYALANALMGEGVRINGEPREGKLSIVASHEGLLKIDEAALFAFNMLGDVMCSTLHSNTVVRENQVVAGTRAIPLVVKKAVIEDAAGICGDRGGIISVRKIRRPKAGVVITGNEVYHGRVRDAFEPLIEEKIRAFGGEIVGTYFAPDDASLIRSRLSELISAGADLLITTGGMSVDPDDVTRFAIRSLGAGDITYGSPVLPGAMFLVAYIRNENGELVLGDGKREPNTVPQTLIPVLGIPACGMYARTTVFDLLLPRILAGEIIGRRELAELGHGGLCMKCPECQYPVCPFGK